MAWKSSRISLSFRLGTVEIGRVPLKVVVPSSHPIELDPQSAQRPPREDMKREQAAAAVLSSCPVDGPLKPLSWCDGSLRYVRCHFPHYYVEIAGSFEQYLNSWNKQSRKQTRRAVRRYSEQSGGTMPFHIYKDPDEIETFIKLAGELSEQTYQARLLKRGLPTHREFIDKTIELAKKDLFRGYLLNDFEDKKPVAFLYAPAVRGEKGDVIISDIGGFDAEYKDHSPGSVLRYQVIESLFAERRFRVYDLSEGEGSHKHRLATHHIDCAEVYFFKANVPNALLVASHYACEAMSTRAVQLLDELGVKDKVKRALRKG